MPVKWEDLAAGGAGAVDELLFGIPEFVAKKIDRKKVEDWIKANEPAYRTGEMVGTVGSMFLPVPGLGAIKGAKGAVTAARALKGVDTAADIAKGAKAAVDWSKIAKMAGRGALAGAAESGVRGITSEKKLSEIVQDVQRGAQFGALGGAAGGLISEKIPRWLEKAQKTTAQQYLKGRGISTRDMKAAFIKSLPKGAGDAYKAQKAGEYLRDVADFAKTVPRGEGFTEEISKQTGALYEILNDAWSGRFKGASAADVIKGLVNPDTMKKLSEEYGDDAAQAALEYIQKNATGKKGLVGIKEFFQRIGDTARTAPAIAENVPLSSAIQDLAYSLKGTADDIAMAAAEEAGKGKLDVAGLKKQYKLLKPLEKAEMRETLALGTPGGGSPTFEKRTVGELVSALGAPAIGAAVGGTSAAMTPEEGKNKLAQIAIGSLGGAAAMKGLSALSSRGIGALDTAVSGLARKVPEVLPEAISKGLQVSGGMAAGALARAAKAEAAPETPAQEKAADTGAAAGAGEPRYVSQVMDRMRAYAAARGVPEDSPEFQQFAQAVYAATEGFSPDKIGGILYPDPEERKAYTRALTVARRLSEIGPQAIAARPGLLVPETAEQKIARESAVDQLASLVGDVAKERGSEKAAKAALTKILGGRESPERKAELVRLLLAQYGVDLDALTEMGVV